MVKKIYDILPPKPPRQRKEKLAPEEGGKVQVTFVSRNETPILRHEPSREYVSADVDESVQDLPPKRPRRFPVKELFVGGLFIVALGGIYFAAQLAKADVQIWPSMDTLTVKDNIIADTSVTEVSITSKTIPASRVEEIQENWQQFEATGSSSHDTKATGKITVYNKLSPAAPFSLKAGTHFLSDSGKYFVTLDKITIPAAQKNQPGSVEVNVEAQDPGVDFNIGTSKFAIPKLSGTTYYYSIWAESKEAMSGGSTGTVKKVSADDIDYAKDSLTGKLFAEAENALKAKLSPDDILLDGAISKDVLSSAADVKPDAVVDMFTESAKVKVSALVFKKSDLEKIIIENVNSQLLDTQTFLSDSLSVNYDPSLIDMKGGKESLSFDASVKTYNKIDVNYLAGLIGRKSADEIKSVIDGKYGAKVSTIRINLWPFWVKKAPSDKGKISVNLNFQ